MLIRCNDGPAFTKPITAVLSWPQFIDKIYSDAAGIIQTMYGACHVQQPNDIYTKIQRRS